MYVCSCGNLEMYVHKEGSDLSLARSPNVSPGKPFGSYQGENVFAPLRAAHWRYE